MEPRLKYEHLMIRAFGLKGRKEIRFADADFYDLEDAAAISTAMMAAFCNLINSGQSNTIWLRRALERLEEQPHDMNVIIQILYELPVAYL